MSNDCARLASNACSPATTLSADPRYPPPMTHPAIMLVLLASPAIAQPNSPQDIAPMSAQPQAASQAAPPTRQVPSPTASLSFSAQHNFASDFSDAPGDVAVTRAAADAAFTYPTSQRGRLTIGLEAERSIYNFTDATGFVSGATEPWDDVMAAGASLRFSRQHDAQWSYFAGVDVQSSGQDNADFSDTITYGGSIGFIFADSDRLRYGFALGAHTRLEDDTTFLPIPIIAWRFDEHWSLASSPRRGGGQIALTYAPSETLSFSAAVGFESRDFRLADDNPTPRGVGRDSRMPVALGVDWTVHPQVHLTAEAGVNFGQEFTLDDVGGNRINKLDADMGFFAGVGVRVEF